MTNQRPLQRSDTADGGGQLVTNLMHFCRTLRAAGLPVGPGQVLEAIGAVRAVGLDRRDDFYWALHAVLVKRYASREIFDQAFHVFWRNPRLMERMLALMLPVVRSERDSGDQRQLSRRLTEALFQPGAAERDRLPDEQEAQRSESWSDREVLRHKDFEQMSAEELALARELILSLELPVPEVTTRRFRRHPHGAAVDMRASLRAALRNGPDTMPLVRRRRRRRPPPLVILCDISGSMERYSRMLLHFMHALAGDRERVYSFVFGTRLTAITHYLKSRDVDDALAKVTAAVADWSGGTRIGACLHEFNRAWSRRVLAQGAVVLLITDGLDRDAGSGLGREMERLHKSCRRLIWLNPLLRFEGFEPRSLGVREMLPHVDDFRAAHNLDSLAALGAVLGREGPRRSEETRQWLTTLH